MTPVTPVTGGNDANGNLITETLGTEQTAYTYNGADRMTGVSTTAPIALANQSPSQATSAQYHYDALGRRVQEDYRRTQTTPNTGGRTNQRIDQGTRITFYDALGFNPTARPDYRGQTRSPTEGSCSFRHLHKIPPKLPLGVLLKNMMRCINKNHAKPEGVFMSSGRNKGGIITFQADATLTKRMEGIANRSDFIRTAIRLALDNMCPVCGGTGTLSEAEARE